MSVLIKGMEMPKSCYDCEIRIKCGCKVANDSGWLNNKIDDHCPFAFVEVPKHGRLIDADAEVTAMYYDEMTEEWKLRTVRIIQVLADCVDNSISTVIEAEE